ncbi:cytochrome P450 2U1-like isoform X2 [Zophobas morio]
MDVVVVANGKILKKILARNETFERPSIYTLRTVFADKGLVYTNNLTLWKDQRKFVKKFFKLWGANKVASKKKTLETLIKKRLDEFMQVITTQGDHFPLDPHEFVTRYVTNVSSTLLLGKPFASDDKNLLILKANLDKVVELAGPGGTPLNFLPCLRFLPKFNKCLISLQQAVGKVREIQNQLITECEKSITDTNADSPSNLIEMFLLQMSKGPKDIYNLDQLHSLLFDLHSSATTTVTTWLLWILLHLAQYETVQNKVRRELLQVVRGKTIEMDDFANLHYTKATIAEVARIRTIGPLGFPHYTSEDICIDGFPIMKDTTIIPLLWAIHMDPKVWKNPEEFRPERFLNDDGKFYKPETFLPFQTGKRICIGEEMATMMTSMFVATVVRNFKLGCVDSSPLDFTGVCGIMLNPKPQQILFTRL